FCPRRYRLSARGGPVAAAGFAHLQPDLHRARGPRFFPQRTSQAHRLSPRRRSAFGPGSPGAIQELAMRSHARLKFGDLGSRKRFFFSLSSLFIFKIALTLGLFFILSWLLKSFSCQLKSGTIPVRDLSLAQARDLAAGDLRHSVCADFAAARA